MKVAFTTVRFSEGYDTAEVDAYLDTLERALVLQDGSLTVQDVTGARFTPTRFTPGYSMDEVDTFLDDVLPMVTGDVAYDPDHDYSPRSGAGSSAESRIGARTEAGHPAEPRPGLVARLLGRAH